MLELLHIENIAIIEAADIEFAPGFNALTGETGAGKSIVIDSLSAVLGQRTSRELIRTGAEKAFVSAAFSGMAPELTEELGIQPEADGTLLLQREIQTDGKNVCRVNGRPVTVGQLRALGARLLNIHGQHDGQQLLDEEQHIVYLDSFGRVESLAITYAEKYKNFTDIRRQIGALQMDEAEKARRVDTLQYQIEELRRAKLTPGEEEELTARRGMLRNAEKFLDAVAGADYALNGDDSGGGALSALRQAQDALGGVRHLDDAFGQLYERLGEAYSEVYDIAATVEDKRGELDVSPGELDRVESRMDLLYRLKKKYGATVEDMLDYQARCEAELAQIAGYMHDIGNVINRIDHAQSGAVMAFRILDKMGASPEETATIITAIGNHDEKTAFPVNPVAAALILADKMDVRANRVREKARAAFDIHDRVNYSVKKHEVTLTEKEICLTLAIDTEVCAVIEYFEIFMDRMLLCRRAAEKLGLHFALVINGQRMA